MKFIIIFLISIGSMQGCSTNKMLTDDEIQQSIIDEFKNNKNQAGQTVELGGTCNAGNDLNAGCSANSMQLLGMPCTCWKFDGVHNGVITK
jgi:hypothetical protein|tara:strand:- start:155 stop:427 length:273 start_codon:yes stop_codon:yes gene_type:complete